jgi:hypothetical protein
MPSVWRHVWARELNVDVEKVVGRFGEFKILFDGGVVVDSGPLAAVGVLPSGTKIVEAVRSRLRDASRD